MKNKIYRKAAFKKVRFSLIVGLIYVLGCHILLPGGGKGLAALMNQSPNLSLAFRMTGMSLSRLSLFSLGLGPWMSALIFWRVLLVTKAFRIQNLTDRRSYQIKFIFSLLLGGIQSFMIITQMKQMNGGGLGLPYWALMLLLLSGLAGLIWLGSLNADYGIGGPTLIVLLGMTQGWPDQFFGGVRGHSWSVLMRQWLLPFLFLFIFSFVIFRFYQGERRLPLTHIMLDEQFSQEAYLPISTNPSGGMPFMFAFSVVLFPQYLLFLLKTLYKGNDMLVWFYQEVQLDHLFGVVLLIVFVVLLTFGYSYVNIDYVDISEGLQKRGDYFYGVYPGKNTERFLFHHISRMAAISALLNVLIVGAPALLALYYPKINVWSNLLPTWFILIILMQEFVLQFTTLYHRNDYQPMVREERG